jgi:drug/metabolite transporter (DMT)-like permease
MSYVGLKPHSESSYRATSKAPSMYRNPLLVIGLLAFLIGFVFLFAQPIGDPEVGPGFVAYWWIGAPAMVIGMILMAMGYRRHRITRSSRVRE